MSATTSLGHRLTDPVTAHMRRDFAHLHVDLTVGEALASIRENPPDGRIIYFYVIDEENRLHGVVPTRRLLLTRSEAKIADIMVREVIAIPGTASVLESCEFFILHRLLAFPVVDDDRRLLGIVDVDLYTDELTDLEKREDNDELFQLIGLHLTDAQQSSSLAAFRLRFPWLMANIAGGILAAFLSGVFETAIQKEVAIALFIPVVLALAESVSIQSVSLALQTLRGRPPTFSAFLRKVRVEIGTGLCLGVACGLAVGIVALVWLGRMDLVACLLGGIAGGVTCATVIGLSMPHLIRILDREPQVAAGPLALAITDMATLLIYFSLARWMFA